MKKYIEKYGKELVQKSLRNKRIFWHNKNRIWVKMEESSNNLRRFRFEFSNLIQHVSICVYVQKIGTTYTVTDCGYSATKYLENNLSTEKNIILSEIKFKNVPSNKLVKAICECASKSYKLIATGK